MDLLASILAYLGVVTGIVVAVALSYNRLVYESYNIPQTPQPTAIAARSSAPKMAKPKAGVRRAPVHVNRVAAAAGDARSAAAQRRDRARARRLAHERSRRHLAHRVGAPRQWAYRPAAPFAFGAADIPRPDFGGSVE